MRVCLTALSTFSELRTMVEVMALGEASQADVAEVRPAEAGSSVLS